MLSYYVSMDDPMLCNFSKAKDILIYNLQKSMLTLLKKPLEQIQKTFDYDKKVSQYGKKG